MRSTALIAVLFATVLAAGCAQEDDCGPACEPVDVDPFGVQHRYVVDSIDLPDSPNEAQAFGMVLDGNERGRPNNALGQILSTLYSASDVELDDPVRSAINDGRILHLLEVQATALDTAAGVGAQLFLGVDRDGYADDNFSGSESFAIEAGHFSQPLAGDVVDGRLTVDLGTLPLRIMLPYVDTPLTLQLEAARIEADVISATEIRGSLGGVLVEEDIEEVLLPVIQRSLQAIVALDCVSGVCTADSHGEILLALFDEDEDGEIASFELADNSLLGALLAADVDMFDADGNIRPGCDGADDALSFGVGFTATPARFTPPQYK